jgi:glycosyltransferase involved in cell wall biosynthesis
VKKKILILLTDKMKYIPAAKVYLDALAGQSNEVHIVSWNRNGLPDEALGEDAVLHELRRPQPDQIPLRKKIPGYLTYRGFIIKTVREVKPDFIISVQISPLIIIADVILLHFRNRFLIDYRDAISINNPLVHRLTNMLSRHAKYTFVSSDGFRRFFDAPDALYTIHNITYEDGRFRDIRREAGGRNAQTIKVLYVGMIRGCRNMLELIEGLAEDSRFELVFRGVEQEDAKALRRICAEKKYSNVFFRGAYPSSRDRRDAFQAADMIVNIMPSERNRHCMHNKYYDGITFYLPQVCTAGTFNGEMAEQKGVGAALNPHSPRFADELYEYYRGIDWPAFYESCDAELARVKNEMEQTLALLKDI